LASILAALPMSAGAQQGPSQQPQNQPAPKKPAQPTHQSGAKPGGSSQPGTQGSRNVGTGASHQAGRFEHGHVPSHNFGGHAYHGRVAWERGHWRHEMRNGRYGWWWDVDGAWYFYPQPMDGPPGYISDFEVMDEGPMGEPDGPPAVGEYPPPGAPGYPPPSPDMAGYPPPPPPPPPPGQDTVGGAIGGALLGGLIGGVLTGRAGGAAVGAIVGGTTGAAIGAQAEMRHGYYWWHGSCYYRYPSGEYAPVGPRYCY